MHLNANQLEANALQLFQSNAKYTGIAIHFAANRARRGRARLYKSTQINANNYTARQNKARHRKAMQSKAMAKAKETPRPRQGKAKARPGQKWRAQFDRDLNRLVSYIKSTLKYHQICWVGVNSRRRKEAKVIVLHLRGVEDRERTTKEVDWRHWGSHQWTNEIMRRKPDEQTDESQRLTTSPAAQSGG